MGTTEDAARFGGLELRGTRLYSGGAWSEVGGARATWWCEASSKGPDVGRAIGGLIGGAVLGALIGFLIFGGIFTMAAFAIVIGLVAGLKPVEHGKAHVVVDYPDGRRADIPGPLDDWQNAQRLAGAITGLSESPA